MTECNAMRFVFQDPEPLEPSNEVINQQFYRSGSRACQNDLVMQKPVGAENCLHLSVYTRDVKPEQLKPVLVWIHGGAFILGSCSKDFYNPEFLMRTDIVVVGINYRLGAFGMSNSYCNHLIPIELCTRQTKAIYAIATSLVNNNIGQTKQTILRTQSKYIAE